MKIAERQHSVKIDGEVSVNEFGFIFNGKMVKLLSDNLYNDKIAAIVRELSTNAYDSHVEAGTQNKPFDVHLPTYSEPYFYVRDYGTGMSPERVDTIYRFYGASDRTDSNEFTGGMGLGSKVPFCYNTQTFTVDSWYDGVHTCYSCFIGENGKPNIATMSQEKSDKPSGVMVKLQTKSDDCSNFKYAAENIYSVFPVCPKFIGTQAPNIRKPTYLLSANDNTWKLRANDSEGCRVIMGNVAYPVEINDANITSSQRAVMQSCFDLFVEVGSVSVDIGREGLSYDNRTRTRIGNMLNRIVTDYNKRIQEEIDKCANLWEARKKFVELYNKAELRIMDGSKIQYKNTTLFDRSGYHTIGMSDLVEVVKDRLTGQIVSQPVAKITSITVSWRASKYEKNERINAIPANDKVVFFENDLSIGAFVRAGHIAKRDGCTVLLFKFNDDAARQAVADRIGCDVSYFTKISTIPSPTVRQSGNSHGSFGRVLRFNNKISYHNSSVTMFWMPDQEIDFDEDSGVYVEFNRFNYRTPGETGFYSPQSLSTILSEAEICGITIPAIYGIKTADIDRVKDNPNWVNIFDYLKGEVAKKLPTVHTAKIKFFQEGLRKVCNGNSYYQRKEGKGRISFEVAKAIAGWCTTDNEFTQYVKAMVDAHTETKNGEISDNMIHLANILKVAMPKYPDFVRVDLDKLEAEAYNKYTMLGLIDCGQLEGSLVKQRIARYIDSIS